MRFCLEAANIGTWDWDIESGSVRWSEIWKESTGNAQDRSEEMSRRFRKAFTRKTARAWSTQFSERWRAMAGIARSIVKLRRMEVWAGWRHMDRLSTIHPTDSYK